MIENGKRNPSHSFLKKLVTLSNKPEEYWIYGIGQKSPKINSNIAKVTSMAIEKVIEMNLITDFNSLFQENSNNIVAEELLIAALKADLMVLTKNKINYFEKE